MANMMQLQKFWSVLTTLSVSVMASQAFGHPGHGSTEPTSPLHAAEPVHLLPIVAIIVSAAFVSLCVVRRMVKARHLK